MVIMTCYDINKRDTHPSTRCGIRACEVILVIDSVGKIKRMEAYSYQFLILMSLVKSCL